jgi:hypothetical protein
MTFNTLEEASENANSGITKIKDGYGINNNYDTIILHPEYDHKIYEFIPKDKP